MTTIQYFDGGMWSIQGDELHLDIPKLLARLGIEDTQENRDLAVKVAVATARQHPPNTQITLTPPT